MKKSVLCALSIYFFISFLVPGLIFAEEKRQKSVNERILEILIEQKIITKRQFEELKKLAREEAKGKRLKEKGEIKEKPHEKKAAKRQSQKEFTFGKPEVTAGYDKGFYIKTTDNRSKIRFDGRFQGDFKTYMGDHEDHASFFVRRARLCTSGTLHKYYDFRVEAEFGKGGARLNDGFLNIGYVPFAQLKFGQFKVPFSMEELHSDNWIDFVERSIANRLAPSRDIGVMLHGSIGDEFVYYQLGLFNGYRLNRVNDPDGGKDVALRMVAAPFKRTGFKAVEGLRVAGALTRGHVNLTENEWWNSGDFRTAAGTNYLRMRNGVVQHGYRTRGGLELHWDWGATVLKGEYMAVDFEGLEMAHLKKDFRIQGGYVSISHMLTGEKFVYKKGRPGRIVPLNPFDPFHRDSSGWGALQLGARFEYLKAEQAFLTLDYADYNRYTDKTYGFTLGVNWYPNAMVRFMLNYYHMVFDDPILVRAMTMDDEDSVLARIQIVF
ncbi:MAG: hypothetical protein GY849_07595 [Deltaproteobacteria bacterium]|nr:hypothetical protein [Deltaproteobacteria bacterium]